MSWNSMVFLILLLPFNFHSSNSQKSWVRAGHWYSGSGSSLPISEIDSTLFTHLMCAFASINSSSYQIQFNSTEEQYFSTFSAKVKDKSPLVVPVLSIWSGEESLPVFSSLINHSTTRKSFIDSSISTVRLYGFDGLELFGVLPSKATNMSDLGTLLEEWRAAIGNESKASGKAELLLVMSSYYMPTLDTVSYPVSSMASNLDWIHILAYKYYLPTRDNFTGLHAALCGMSEIVKTDDGLREWNSAGVSTDKLVLGLPYFGYAWNVLIQTGELFGVPASGPSVTEDGLIGYRAIKSFILTNGNGADALYNGTYKVNYISVGSTWINFDDVDSIEIKVSYARSTGLRGYDVFHLADDHNWVLSVAAQREGASSDHQGRTKVLVPVLGATFAALASVGTVTFCYLRRKGIVGTWRKSQSAELSDDASNLEVFSYSTIKAATGNFSSDNKLGQGGFGTVYKGKLSEGKEIAVKRLSKTSHQGEEEFKNEVTLTARLQHVNLVRVLGFCIDREEKMLVYEYMPRKSLDFYLHDLSRRGILDWTTRVKIIEGVTQGLVYLQEYSNYTIIHRDLKASNILLDNEMNPKISDFGMAKLFSKDDIEANTGRIVGTCGYVPPEYVKKGTYSTKYDVYSFGVVLLQIISGKRTACYYGPNENMNTLEYAYELWERGDGKEFMDPTLDDSSSYCKLTVCLQVALLCVQEYYLERPSMMEVSSMLKNETAAIASPKKPAFSTDRWRNIEAPSSRNQIFSVDDSSISQLVPR